MTIQTQVIVIGGGIAGALSSLICCMAEYEVIWIKKNNKFFGGIQLPPNTIKCLERLGLEELLKEIAIPISEIRIRNPLKLSDLKTFSVENYYTVNRMSLFQQLLNSLKKYSSLKILSSSILVCTILYLSSKSGF